ncbi:hypothetical protein QJS66_08760 [Kocuria rhizophila]|nr:hypothetical protein QJS66_08760 [Kocuria rhizophila]
MGCMGHRQTRLCVPNRAGPGRAAASCPWARPRTGVSRRVSHDPRTFPRAPTTPPPRPPSTPRVPMPPGRAGGSRSMLRAVASSGAAGAAVHVPDQRVHREL